MKTIFKAVTGVAAVVLAAGTVVLELNSANAVDAPTAPIVATTDAPATAGTVAGTTVANPANPTNQGQPTIGGSVTGDDQEESDSQGVSDSDDEDAVVQSDDEGSDDQF